MNFSSLSQTDGIQSVIDSEGDEKSPELVFCESLVARGQFRTHEEQIFHWNGSHWEDLSSSELEKLAWCWLTQKMPNRATPRMTQSCGRAATMHVPRLTPGNIGQDFAVLPLLNGYLHIDLLNHSSCMHEPDPSLGLTHKINCIFDPLAEAIEFKRFLSETLPNESVRQVLSEFVGSTLIGDTRFQRAAFFQGKGGNGKGTLAEIIRALHGKAQAVDLSNLGGFKMSNAINASLIYADECPEQIDLTRLCSLITGDPIQVDIKHKKPITCSFKAKWLVCGNEYPKINDNSIAFWRRFLIFPFKKTFIEESSTPQLAKQIISNESSGILNWAIDGLIRLIKRGQFSNLPAEMILAAKDGRIESNSVFAWIQSAEPIIDGPATVLKELVFRNYTHWCKANNIKKILSSPQFWREIQALSEGKYVEGRITTGKRPRTCNVYLPFST